MAIDYGAKEKPYRTFDMAKVAGIWNPSDIDLEADKENWETLSDPQRYQILVLAANNYEGEESVTKTLVPYPLAVSALEDVGFDTTQEEMFLTSQLWEEAKHADFYSRYFEEVIGSHNTVQGEFEGETRDYRHPRIFEYFTDDLNRLAMELTQATLKGDQRELRHLLGEAVMHYMCLLEAQLAERQFAEFRQIFDETGALPGLEDGIRNIQSDEGRHKANGRWLLRKLADEDSSIVSEVYEPKFREYFDEIFPLSYRYDTPTIDKEALMKVEKLNYEKSLDVIGKDRFDTVIDVEDRYAQVV
jgi:ribonucleoside-diphosphate reductase beta chain